MNPENMKDTVLNKENRVLLQYKVEDAVQASEVFTKLMGASTEFRKKFLEEGEL